MEKKKLFSICFSGSLLNYLNFKEEHTQLNF